MFLFRIALLLILMILLLYFLQTKKKSTIMEQPFFIIVAVVINFHTLILTLFPLWLKTGGEKPHPLTIYFRARNQTSIVWKLFLRTKLWSMKLLICGSCKIWQMKCCRKCIKIEIMWEMRMEQVIFEEMMIILLCTMAL